MRPPPLRVLQIVKGIDIGGHNGGAENFGIRLARGLRKLGVGVSLCAYYRHNTARELEIAQTLEREGIPFFYALPSARLDFLAATRSLRSFVQENSISILHSHFQVGTLSGMAIKGLGGNLLLLRTAHTPLEFGEGFGGRFSRWLFVRLLYPVFLEHEVAVSRHITSALNSRLTAKLFSKKAVTIPNALDEMEPLDSDELNVEPFVWDTVPPPWIITTVGILNPLKSFDTVIRALPAVQKNIPQVQFVLVGSGQEEYALRELASSLGVDNRVWLLGQRKDVSAILRRSNVLVHPSKVEAMSTVILEAMESRLPVIASDIPGNKDLIQDGVNGKLFPVGDAAALAERICTLYQNPELGENYAKCAAESLDRFSMTTVVEQYKHLYETLIQA